MVIEIFDKKNGALKKTRTSTSFRTQIPETCASTNSAMRATQERLLVSY